MNHIRKYRLPIRYRHPNALRNLVWAIAILLAAYGLWWSITEARGMYLTVVEAEQRIAQAEIEKQEILAVLNGSLVMIDPVGQYAHVARVEWDTVELVK